MLVLRVGLGIIFPFHAWLKLNPTGPSKGPAGFIGFLKQSGVPLPRLLGWVVIPPGERRRRAPYRWPGYPNRSARAGH